MVQVTAASSNQLTNIYVMYRISLPIVLLCCAQHGFAADRPNILWLFAEDTSPWMGCYGHDINVGQTPNIDALAEGGVRFSRAYVPAPVCSPCRSAMMGGQSQIRFGAHEHRSSRGPAKIHLPERMKLLPQLVKEAGYFTFNLGKTDYNFVWDEKATYSLLKRRSSSPPWNELIQNQPFFGQIQTAGGKSRTDRFPDHRKVDPNSVTVPPDYPQDDVYRKVVAQHYDAIRMDDDFIGKVMQGLKDSGLAENTIVVYFSDHGANNLVRHKQMPTEGGLHVPFIINGPDPYVPAPSVRDDLVNMLDLSATTLAWAGVKIPKWYEGQFLFGDKVIPRSYVAAAKDRLDHTIDRVRTVRSDRYRYTRNYKTDRILLQPQYRDPRDFVIHLRDLYASGRLSPKLTEIYFGERPSEELYDVRKDPSQLNNLAADPTFSAALDRHRKLLDQWLAKGDAGEGEESIEEIRFQAGGAQGHKWGRAVNPEYEIVRADTDGDGLSDDWEVANGRDPNDGKLLFTFDCGGWQTEGWKGTPNLGNIAGRQGFLEFALDDDYAEISRTGLHLDSRKNDGKLVLSMRVEADTTVTLFATTSEDATARQVVSINVPKGDGIAQHSASMTNSTTWQGSIRTISLVWIGEPGSKIEIDSIEVH
jgi:N-sulfoglucosamine sulfohydrolase